MYPHVVHREEWKHHVSDPRYCSKQICIALIKKRVTETIQIRIKTVVGIDQNLIHIMTYHNFVTLVTPSGTLWLIPWTILRIWLVAHPALFVGRQGTPNQLPEFPSQKSKLRYNIQGVDQRDKKVRGCKEAPPILPPETREKKLDPKWVPERAKQSIVVVKQDMKGPWRLSRIEHNPKISNLFSRRAFLMTPDDGVPDDDSITDPSWNADIHARRSKHVRRANQVKSNDSNQISQVNEVDAQEPVMLDQDMLDVDMLVWSSNSSQAIPNTQEKLVLLQHMLDVNMLVWSRNSSQASQDTEEK